MVHPETKENEKLVRSSTLWCGVVAENRNKARAGHVVNQKRFLCRSSLRMIFFCSLLYPLREHTMPNHLINGDGIWQAHRALEALAKDSKRLDRARKRFSRSPPPCRSYNGSTLSQLSNEPKEGQLRLEKRKWQLEVEHRASRPFEQFRLQSNEEKVRLIEAAHTPNSGTPPRTWLASLASLADSHVMERWSEQGIWKYSWGDKMRSDANPGGWKHEEPLEPEPKSVTDPEAEVNASIVFPRPTEAEREPRRPKSGEEVAKQQSIREREREASRPFHQFVYQMSKEREWIQDVIKCPKSLLPSDINTQTVVRALERGGWPSAVQANIPDPPDINAIAYEMVKNTWIKRKIWNTKWGVMPGMSWKHEHPFEKMLSEGIADDAASIQAEALDGSGGEAGDVSPRPILDARLTHEGSGLLDMSYQEAPAATFSNVDESSDHENGRGIAESSHGPVFAGLNSSPQEPPSAIDSLGLSDGDANRCSTVSPSQTDREESQDDPRSSPRWAQQQGNEEELISPTESVALGINHSSKISKARRKSNSNIRRRSKAPILLSDARKLSADLNNPALPPKFSSVPPRRSRRLREARRKMVAQRTGIDAMNPCDGGS